MNKIVMIACAFFLSMSLTSCFSGKQYATTRRPHFLDDIPLNNHNKKNVTENGVSRRPAEKKEEEDENWWLADINPAPPPKGYITYKRPAGKGGGTPAASEETVSVRPKDYKEEKHSIPKRVRNKYADILGVNPKDIDNYALYRFIDRWYGTNYKLGGCDESGIDCSGFAQKLFADVYGIDLQRTAMEQFGNCKRIKRSADAEEGDLVFFRQRGKRITHVGVYLANDFFVHSSSSQGVVISNLNEEYWHKHFAGIGRIPSR